MMMGYTLVNGEPEIFNVDNVVICAGQEPRRELVDRCAAGKTVHLTAAAMWRWNWMPDAPLRKATDRHWKFNRMYFCRSDKALAASGTRYYRRRPVLTASAPRIFIIGVIGHAALPENLFSLRSSRGDG